MSNQSILAAYFIILNFDMFHYSLTYKILYRECRVLRQCRSYNVQISHLLFTSKCIQSICNASNSSSYLLLRTCLPNLIHKSRTDTSIWYSKHYSRKFMICGRYNYRNYSNESPSTEKKLSLIQRFKKLYKESWYVLVPVHIVTSVFWFTSFYQMAKSGVDLANIFEIFGASEKLIEKVRNGPAGYVAVAYALYKIVTPIRYAVTIGGTSLSLKYLRRWGYIKEKK